MRWSLGTLALVVWLGMPLVGCRSGAGGRGQEGGATGRGGLLGGGSPGSAGRQVGSGGAAGGGGAGDPGGLTGGRGGSSDGGGRSATGGTAGRGGSVAISGGTPGTGGTGAFGGATSSGGSTGSGACSLTVTSGTVSDKMATVGVVEWSTTAAELRSAQIVYRLNDAGASILNQGGVAPVELEQPNHRTLLLGLKPSSVYTYHVEATAADGTTCTSADGTLTTGFLSGAPTVTRTVSTPAAQAAGFIVTCTGVGAGSGASGSKAYIVDADGTVVWSAVAPTQCTRARMDYEGVNLWMLSVNLGDGGGEMRFLSMDGQNGKTQISGLSSAHHDFTVLPGKIAAMAWATPGARDPESNLVEMAADGSGSPTTLFTIGANLYAGGASALGAGGSTFHSNYIAYHPADDTFTIADRNPNLVVKVKHDGTPVWQIGGSCAGAKAPKCAPGTWLVDHGHDFDDAGHMALFNNGQTGAAHILLLELMESPSAIAFTLAKDFVPGGGSSSLGDVQFLPNGNLLITLSNAGQIVEVDSTWRTVQILQGYFGYADWRKTLYGPPSRT